MFYFSSNFLPIRKCAVIFPFVNILLFLPLISWNASTKPTSILLNPTGGWQKTSLTEHDLVANEMEYLQHKWANRFAHWKQLALEKELDDEEKAKFAAEIKKMVGSRHLRFQSARDGAVFWSGLNMVAAQAWAKSRQGKTTLEQTEGGYLLSTLDLFDNFGLWSRLGRQPPLDKKKAGDIWDIASEKFARQARGDVFIFDVNTDKIGPSGKVRTLYAVEIPFLLDNGAVNKFQRMSAEGVQMEEAMSKFEACLNFLSFLPKPNCGRYATRSVKRKRISDSKLGINKDN